MQQARLDFLDGYITDELDDILENFPSAQAPLPAPLSVPPLPPYILPRAPSPSPLPQLSPSPPPQPQPSTSSSATLTSSAAASAISQRTCKTIHCTSFQPLFTCVHMSSGSVLDMFPAAAYLVLGCEMYHLKMRQTVLKIHGSTLRIFFR